MKFPFLTLLFGAIVTMSFAVLAPDSDAPIPKAKPLSDYFKWIGSDFSVGTSDADRLDDSNNWNLYTGPDNCLLPIDLLCAAIVDYNAAGGTPINQAIFDAIREQYIMLRSQNPPQTFYHGYSFTTYVSKVGGGTISVTITIRLKSD